MKRIPIRSTAIWFLFCLFGGTHALYGQAAASISGRVTDSGGSVVPAAVVQLASVERGTTITALTNEVGIYAFPSVPQGNYLIIIEHPGFRKAEVKGLVFDVGATLERNVQLEVGATQETITVEAADEQVNTVSATVSSVVAGEPVQDLPLNGRDALQLALTQPGVTPTAAGATTFSIAGGRTNSATYLMDGGLNNSVANSTVVVDPNPDTIAEFRVMVNNYSAEYGRSNGGIISVVTKSGTNRIHGTLYDYLRNTDLDANMFFNQSTPGNYSARPVLIRNQFGGTAGGPITIPKVINGKDRFFWFFGYQGTRQNSTTVGSQIETFTPAELTGNFSQASNGGPNAGVAKFLGSHPYFQPNPALAAQAIIAPSQINPVAQAFINTEPLPTSPTGVLTPQGTAQNNVDEFTGKPDFNISQNERLSATFIRSHNPVLNPFSGANVPGYATDSIGDTYFGGITFTSVISPTFLNEAHFNANRLVSDGGVPVHPLPTAQSLGIQITPDLSTGPPIVTFSGSGLKLGFPSSTPGLYADTSYSWTDSVSLIRGHHSFKFGGSLAEVQNNGQFAFETNGTLTFSGANGIGTGLDLADFLLGVPNQFTQWPDAFSAIRGKEYALFAQDEWKLRPNLTLSIGLRYEYDTPKSDPQRRNYMIIPGDQSTKFPLAPLGLVFPCDPKAPCPGIYYPDRDNFAPRFGVAWDPFGKGQTSVRAGFGVFYDILNGQDQQNQNGTPPFYSAEILNFTAANIPASGPSTIISNPYGTAGVVNPFPSQPLSPTTSFAKFLPYGSGGVLIDPNQRNPYTYQYNLTLQQALAGGFVLQAGYVGSSSHRQIVNQDIDPFIVGTTERPLNLQPGLQYPNAYTYMTLTDKSLGSSNYNALVSSVTKRLGDSRGVGKIFFTLSNTWSKTLSDADAYGSLVGAYNQHQFYGPANYDVRERLVLSGGWELPFANLLKSAPKRLTTGWSLYPIFYTQTGMPIDFSAGLVTSSTNPGPDGTGDVSLIRPDWTGGSQQMLNPENAETFTVNGKQVTGHFFFNPSDFMIPACYSSKAPPGTAGGCPAPTDGNLQRNTFRGLGITNFDLSLEKKTAIKESVQLLFRAEFFNILNHTEFLNSTGQVSVNSAFIGQSSSTAASRIGQLALKLVF